MATRKDGKSTGNPVIQTQPSTLSDRIRALRLARGLSQAELAAASQRRPGMLPGLTPGLVAKLETGRNKASSAKVREGLAAAFKMSPRQLDAYLGGAIELDRAKNIARDTFVGETTRRMDFWVAVRYHPQRWSSATLAAAFNMHVEDQPSAKGWAEILDRVEAALKGGGFGGNLYTRAGDSWDGSEEAPGLHDAIQLSTMGHDTIHLSTVGHDLRETMTTRRRVREGDTAGQLGHQEKAPLAPGLTKRRGK